MSELRPNEEIAGTLDGTSLVPYLRNGFHSKQPYAIGIVDPFAQDEREVPLFPLLDFFFCDTVMDVEDQQRRMVHAGLRLDRVCQMPNRTVTAARCAEDLGIQYQLSGNAKGL